eukprot:SAG11_NODE_22580_length_403_cov_1.289474_2_plen_20_part_01
MERVEVDAVTVAVWSVWHGG